VLINLNLKYHRNYSSKAFCFKHSDIKLLGGPKCINYQYLATEQLIFYLFSELVFMKIDFKKHQQ